MTVITQSLAAPCQLTFPKCSFLAPWAALCNARVQNSNNRRNIRVQCSGCGFSSHVKIMGKGLMNHSTHLRLLHQFHALMPRINPQWFHAWRWLQTSVPWKVVGEFYPYGFPQYAWIAQLARSDFIGSRVYESSAVTCHLHLWQND